MILRLRRLLSPALFATLILAGARPAPAQEGVDGVATGLGNRFQETQTALTNDRGVFEAVFMHRFLEEARQAGGGGLWGLGGGSAVWLGIDYVFLKNLAVQVAWQNINYDYEFALKWTLLRPTESLPVAVGLRGGLNWDTAFYTEKMSSGFGQLLVNATIANRATVGVAPAYVQRNKYATNIWNVPVQMQVRITDSFWALGEFIPKKDYVPDTVYQWSFGLEKALYHHRFQLWIGNALPTAMNLLIPGGLNGGATSKNIHVGFNIARSFDLVKK
jgi:hypothetical protein